MWIIASIQLVLWTVLAYGLAYHFNSAISIKRSILEYSKDSPKFPCSPLEYESELTKGPVCKFFNTRCVKSVQIRGFFWSVFSPIRDEYREMLQISPYSVRMRENTGQEFPIFRHFSHSDYVRGFAWQN